MTLPWWMAAGTRAGLVGWPRAEHDSIPAAHRAAGIRVRAATRCLNQVLASREADRIDGSERSCRLKNECGASVRAIAVAVGVARSTVQLCLARARRLGWPSAALPILPLAAATVQSWTLRFRLHAAGRRLRFCLSRDSPVLARLRIDQAIDLHGIGERDDAAFDQSIVY